MERGQKMATKEINELAEEHSEWFSKVIKFVYKEAFIHGYKHGKKGD